MGMFFIFPQYKQRKNTYYPETKFVLHSEWGET